jgi:subtilase family serine protease
MDRTIDFPAYRRGNVYPRLASLLLLLLPLALSAAPCDPPVTNPILCENTKPGNPSTEWEVSGSGDPSIQGFATDISVNHGTTVHFKVKTGATDYRVDIYRLGYYGGMGARKVATVQPSAVLPQVQPACLNDPGTGLNDCGNWAESASWAVPADAVSGIYIARLVREDASPGESHIAFIVRDDEGHSPILFQTSDTTWQAYNQYGGNSLYVGGPGTNPGRAYKVSYNRPFTTRGTSNEDWLFNAEYPMVRWLEANGYNVSYFTGVDSDRIGSEILDHQVFLSVGHDEYWSGGQRANVEAARAAGKHLAFFSGNEVFWKTRWESSIDASATPYRTLVCYKETHEGAKIDPNPAWTGTWRDNRPINPSPNPENALTGNIFTVNCCSYPMTVGSDDGKLRLWRNTSVANLTPEQTATFPDETVGYEWNEDLDNGSRPPGLFRLSSTNVDVPQRILDQGSTYGPGNATHSLTIYRHSSGALVFGAGTVQWMWGLDSNHDRGSDAPDVRMQQATVNLLADMGIQPGSLQAGLVSATASTDATPPTSQVTSPADGSTVSSGSAVLISGTAADSGGVVGGVEVSTDGGTTWHRAIGRASWSYSWTPGAPGSAVIRSRAVDDSGNIETPSAGVSVTVGAPSCPCSIWNDSFTPANLDPNDHQGVELGVKFRSDAAGFVTGIRFYKGPTNTGTHVGHLWTSGGSLLGTATFSGESGSGWQQATFASPIPVSANTTYIASYFAPVGQYAFNGNYFASAFDNSPLHALADGTDGSNGVYKYGGGFPTDTFGKTNYWVDVVFSTSGGNDTTPPSVLSVTPFDGAPAVAATANATATFNEPLDASTVTSSTFTLQGPGGPVAAAVSWDPATLKATLDPTSSLAFSTAYTATLKSGAAGIKDQASNALASDYIWSFTTAGPPPPPPDQGPGGPILVVAGANAFGRYYAEILRAEGLNAFDVKNIGSVNATVLGGYDVVILGEQALTATQATMFSDWVTNAGGNLIAMRPDADLYGLLGVTAAGGTLINLYYKVDGSAAPGAGIVTQTMQFHGTADKYTLSGATAVATLYSDASTATANPAVTMRSVGSNGGHAAAFAFDLARSIVYTRQGNPAWAGDSRDGQDGPIRADNLYFGAKSGDVQPDWIDFTKVAIPQADEAQRLLANLIGTINLPRKPFPRFWYFPKGKKAAVIMTGDDHANGGTAGRFDAYKAASPAGCSVADWDCIRSTSYIYPNAPLTDSQAVGYEADGFEVALHVTTGCDNFTPSSLETDFADQLAAFTAKYGSVSPPATNRTHCIPWSDWSTHPKTELAHGIRLDTNYYYWPPAWIADRPGMFTGSGMPMRFADLDGTMIDVYQATTQMTDESGQTFPKNIDALLDKATGAEGYYGAFTANMHTDSVGSSGSDAIVASAKAHGVPVVSSRQMLTWLDGRNGSSFQSLAWAGNKLTFTISVGAGASNLQAMVPTVSAAGGLTGITRNGAPVSFTTQTIKGVVYAFVPALLGAYEAQYAVDTTGSATDTTVADFSAGTLDANTRVSQIEDGEVILAGAVNEEFSGSGLPAGWSGAPWAGGGSVAVSGGQLTVDGARAGTDAAYAPGLALEFGATFGASAFEHVGFAGDFDSNTPWIYFSTKDTTNTLYARTHTGASAIDNPIAGSWIGTPHRYRIEWSASSVRFFIDGNLVDTQTVSIPNSLRILASEFNSGAPGLSMDWLRLSPYAAAGTFLSRIFDAGAGGSWTSISSTRDLPAGTSIALSVRSGATPTPDGSWSAFTAVPGSGGPLSSTSRYLQYRAELATSDPLQTPALRDVTVGFTVSPVTHTLTVTRTGTGAATSTVTSTPAGINCAPTCVNSFDGGTVVTLLPAPGATYVFGGWSGDADCADGVVTLDADKTCTAAFNTKPDLTVSALTAPASAGAGATISVTDTTKNLSGGPASPGTSNTKIWLSTDAVLDAGDTLLGTRPVPSLNPLAFSTGSTSVVIPAGKAPGSYFLIANADGDGSVPESNEGNNVRTKAITVLGPDLSVTVLTAPTASGANRTISIADTTRNTTGAGPAPASTTSYYLSIDAVWDGGDIPFASRDVPALAGGTQSTQTANRTLPSVANGNYYIIAKADSPLAIAESNEANNTRAKAITIGADLSVSVVGAPVKSGAGLSITVSDTTANAAGRSDVPDSTTAYYLSSDAVLGGDTLVGSRTTGAIPSGGNSQGSASVTIPVGTATGTWYIIAKADDPNGVFETSETNNTRAKSIAIGPDLFVYTIAAPLSAHPGQTINVTPTTRNQGGGSSVVSSTTKIYLRPPSGPDTFLGSRTVPALAPNASDAVAVSVTIPLATPTGNYSLFVVADDGNAVVETIETNNTKLKAITIN